MQQTKPGTLPAFVPPPTANWTGRTPRTSTEAFGHQWGTSELGLTSHKPSVVIAVVLTFVAGFVAGLMAFGFAVH